MLGHTHFGMHGNIDVQRLSPAGDDSLPAPIDLVAMAQKSLQYLAHNPDPAHGYQCRFNYYLLQCPPFSPSTVNWVFDVSEISARDQLLDPIALGDTENRNDIAFTQMWEMTGAREAEHVHDMVRRRLESYIRTGEGGAGDDVCWVVPYCCSGDIDAPCVMTWTTGKLLQSATDLYRLTGNAAQRDTAQRLFTGLRRLATWESGRAYFDHGWQGLREDGGYAHGYDGHYPAILTPLVNYWLATGDAEAMEFARAMADGFLADLQPGHLHRPDGRVLGHNHCQMHAVRGVAQLGAVTGDWRYLHWAKAAYDYYWARAFDTGWQPETVADIDHATHSETCLTADMLEMAVWFARAGQPALWDRVDRAIRNYFVPAQFTVTPQLLEIWHTIHAGKTPEQLAAGEAQLRELEGGFLSALTPNDRLFLVPDGHKHHGQASYQGQELVFDMMGCCPPEGMRAIYLAWANTVTDTADGILVNLPFDHDGPLATVRTTMPREGYLGVTAKTARDYYLRPPSWAPRDQVRAWRNGTAVTPTWAGPAHDYLLFPAVQGDEVLEIRWPLVEFTQQVTARYLHGTDSSSDGGQLVDLGTYTYHWVGSTVTAVDPRGGWLPLFDDITK